MSEPVVRYTLTVTITEPLGIIEDGMSRDEIAAAREHESEEMTSDETKRELERKVIAALSKLDGDVDCECMEAELDTD